MTFLTGLQWWVLLAGAVVLAVLAAFGLRSLVQHSQRHTGEDPVRHAGPLMPTLGALFAFLSAFVIATEWTSQSHAEGLVQNLAAASSRLAWAATAPGAETDRIQSALTIELRSTSTTGWVALADGRETDAVATEEFRALESSVRDSAYGPRISSPAASELLASVDELATDRRALAAASEGSLPLLLFAGLGLAGMALIANAVTLTIRSPGRTVAVVGSIVALVAIDLAIVLVLAAPFRGTLDISPTPLQQVATQIDAGWFSLS